MSVRLPDVAPMPAAGIPSGLVEAVSRAGAFDEARPGWGSVLDACAGGLLAGCGGEFDEGRGGVLAGFGGSLGGLLVAVLAGSAGFGSAPGTSSHASSTESFSSLISGKPS
jgi:hypothetical protein